MHMPLSEHTQKNAHLKEVAGLAAALVLW